MDILLKGGHLIDPVSGKDETCDVMIRNGIIEKIGKVSVPQGSCEVIEMKGKVIAPGFIDMHVHLREPGYEHKETFETGCASAAAGGFTAVCCMPNTNPAIDDESVVSYIIQRGKEVLGGAVNVYPIAAATKGRKGAELSPIAELVEAGAVGLSDDGSCIASADLMRRVLEYSSMYGVPVIQHAEEASLSKGGLMNEGLVSMRLGMSGIPHIAEEIIVARDLLILGYVGASKYHIAHVSTAGTIEMVRGGKKSGLPITSEVTPHHFSLTEEAVKSFDTNTKMNPPLRTKDDIMAIKEGLKDGTIDAIATDHAPHTIDEKDVEYTQAPFGIVGLETALGLSITELVEKKFLTLPQLIEKLSANPRKILSLPEIKIKEGEKANLTLFDPSFEWIVETAKFKSKSKNSPFGGFKLKGKAIGIINNGVFIKA